MRTLASSLFAFAFLALGACAADEAAPEQEASEALAQRTGPAIGFGCRAPKIAIRASNGNYLCAENGGGDAVVANRLTAAEWETFTVNDEGFGKISLQAANGQYVVAENGGGAQVLANRNARGPWEVWEVERISFTENTWAFRAANGQYLVAENGGGGVVNANRDERGPWETFRVVCK